MKTFAEHSLYEQDLDEAYNLILPVALKIGKEIAKLAIPPLSLKAAVKGTVIYTIAKKYDLAAVIEIQKFGIGLIMDVGKWIGVEISSKLATAIFTKAVAVGTVTLGTILISVLAVKNKSKAKEIYAKAMKISSGKKLKLKSLDMKSIGKKLTTKKEELEEGTGKSEPWEDGFKRRVVKTTKPEHLDKGYKWRIKGKDRDEISIKLYKSKPDFAEFKKQMKRVAGHEFGG